MVSRQELVSLDVLGSDEDLQAAARDDRPAGGSAAEAEGRDAAGAVAVRVDGRGQVSDVLISNWWRDELTPSGLREALLSAYRAALGRAAAGITPRASGGASSLDAPTAPDDGYDGDDHGWLMSVRRRLDQTEEALARSGERLTRTPTGERVISGPDGLVRLILTGHMVSEVLIDAGTAVQESPNRLAADALAAFQSID
jgi:DNA-binding protein YbaB